MRGNGSLYQNSGFGDEKEKLKEKEAKCLAWLTGAIFKHCSNNEFPVSIMCSLTDV